ncbi:MAG TPA: hypothetical protein VFU76_12590 [Terriglobales bacterium]|nr:hypothetical protein [Terriglobales bacterium]
MKGRVLAMTAAVLIGTLLPVVACALPADALVAVAHACCHPVTEDCGGARGAAVSCCSSAPHPGLIPVEAKSASSAPPAVAPATALPPATADLSSAAFLPIEASSPPGQGPPGSLHLRI